MISSTILGSILGFAGSSLAPIMGYFEKKHEGKVEIEKMDKAAELAKAGFTQEQVMYTLAARDKEHARLLDHDIEISKGTGFVAALQKLVRPLITYAFFGLFATVEITVLHHAMTEGVDFNEAILLVWDENTEAIFATIITFWFGNRVWEKLRKPNE